MRHLFLPLFLLANPLWADEVQILDGYSDFRIPEERITDRPIALMQDWFVGFPESAAGGPSIVLSANVTNGRLVIEYTDTGGGDDSVKAIQRRMEFVQSDDWRWRLAAYGFRQQCWRSGSDDWTGSACP